MRLLDDRNKPLAIVKGRFHRSVQLFRDWQDNQTYNDYLVTPTVKQITTRILDELSIAQGIRAWSVTGPYGTGKSSFALYLARLLSSNITKETSFKHKSLLPVLIVGNRSSLKPALIVGLAESFKELNPQFAKNLIKASTEPLNDETVLSLYKQAIEESKKAEYSGLLIILDEFGKFLEYTAQNLDTEDLLIMQSLAEMVSRNDNPTLLITILHTGFAEYLDAASEVQRAEWQKVQGRFTDIAFQEPPEQLLKLVSNAITPNFTNELSKAYKSFLDSFLNEKSLEECRKRLPLEDLLPYCLPLHPLTALLLWPLFRSKLAQNERSLFSFLTSEEPFGFQAFVKTAAQTDSEMPLFELDQLYDYVKSALGTSIYQGDAAKRWAEIEDALDRISSTAPVYSHKVVKILSLLWMYGNPVGLRANEATISLALKDKKLVNKALKYLEQRSIIVYRKFDEAYALWEGSDIDLSALLEEARQHIDNGQLAIRLNRSIELRPLVARAHYIKTGTLRYFSVKVIDETQGTLENHIDLTDNADGQICYVLTTQEKVRKELINSAQSLTLNDTELNMFAFPKPIAGLEEALKEVECLRWVKENTPALKGDRVASRELESLIKQAQQHLEDAAGKVLGLRGYKFEPRFTEWVFQGEIVTIGSDKTFTQWLSKLCDKKFQKAAPLHNELLNRTKLSSTSKASLNRLIKAMVANEHTYRLGIKGTPAEISMYESLFIQGGFHKQRNGQWQFGKPVLAWQPIWEAIENFLETTHENRRPLTELYDVLKKPPYGVREGPLPLLICAMILSKKDEIVLYYNGLFQAELYEEILELLVRNPSSFEIKQLKLSNEGRATLNAIREVLNNLEIGEEANDESPLLRIVRPLVITIAKLPAYSKNTKRLNPTEAVSLREAVLRAKDPHDLLLNQIPVIVGINPQNKETQEEFAHALQKCLLALTRAYPTLLDQIEQNISIAFNVHGTSSEVIQQLQLRATPLKGYTTDTKINLFLNEVTRKEHRDWRQALGRAVLQGKPTETWTDNDVTNFQVNLNQLASDFVRLEELVAEKSITNADKIVRVGVLTNELKEVRHTLSIQKTKVPEIQTLVDDIRVVLQQCTQNQNNDQQIKVAALAQILMEIMQQDREGNAN